jgi:hypothetical protein
MEASDIKFAQRVCVVIERIMDIEFGGSFGLPLQVDMHFERFAGMHNSTCV